jgi:UDP-N-acetylglucosamine 4-epimerase
VPRSINDPLTTNEVNISGFLNMLTAVKDSRVKRMVYAASSSTYGDSKELPKMEDRIGQPLSPYAVTKYVNELYADVFSKTYGTDSIGLRYFNVFGPGQDPNGAYAAVIPLFMKALQDSEPAKLNGDGTQTRDFTFIENVIQANVKAMLLPEQPEHNIFNIACGQRISLIELWNVLKGISGTDPGRVFNPARAGDIQDSLADISRAATELDYIPKFDFKQGIEVTYDWFKKDHIPTAI